MTEPPITRAEWIALHMIRQGKEKSRALPQEKYYDPSNREVSMQRTTEIETRADELLQEWWEWSRKYVQNLGVPRMAPYCKESTSNRQWDSSSDISDDSTRRSTMESVEFCIDSLPYSYNQAIGLHMRNKLLGAKVWRPGATVGCSVTYEEARKAIIPKMREKCLI